MKRQPTPLSCTCPVGTTEFSEEWRACPGFPGYQVSTWGHVRSLDRTVTTASGQRRARKGRPLKLQLTKDQYVVTKLSMGGLEWTKLVHILVAHAFMGEPPCPNAQVHHKNHCRQDNRLENLVYKAGAEHLPQHFTGEDANPAGRPPTAKLTEATIGELKRLLALGHSQRKGANLFEITQSNADALWARLNAGITWRYLYVPQPANPDKLDLLVEFEITELIELELYP